jgi:PEP-CTERM motif
VHLSRARTFTCCTRSVASRVQTLQRTRVPSLEVSGSTTFQNVSSAQIAPTYQIRFDGAKGPLQAEVIANGWATEGGFARSVSSQFRVAFVNESINAPGSWISDQLVNFRANQVYFVTLEVSGRVIGNQGSYDAFVDPVFIAPAGYTLDISAGIGNLGMSAVPEPSTRAMMILGFVGIGAMTYRRRKSASLAA